MNFCTDTGISVETTEEIIPGVFYSILEGIPGEFSDEEVGEVHETCAIFQRNLLKKGQKNFQNNLRKNF